MAATTLDLTTVFTPPTTCLQSVFTLSPSGSDVYESGTVTRGIVSHCYPSAFRSVYENGAISGSTFYFVNGGSTSEGIESTTYQTFYSPGICPSGYTTETVHFNTSTFFATCCPSGYTLGGETESNTNREVCTHTILGDYMTLIAAGASNQTIPYPGTAVAAAVKVAYMESDQANLATSTSEASPSTEMSSSAAASPAATSDGTSPTAPVSSETTAPGDSGLSRGAQTGIGVGISLAVLLAVGIGFFWILLRRRKQRDHHQKSQEPAFEKAELPGSPAHRYTDAELAAEGATVHEASEEASKPSEMDSMNVRAELPGNWEGTQAPGREDSRDHRHEAPS